MFNTLEQLFSTIGSWRPTKQNITQLSDPYITIIVQNPVFVDPKVGRNPAVRKHCYRAVVLNIGSSQAHYFR